MRLLTTIVILLITTACSKLELPESSQMLFKIEERNLEKDTIKEYRFFKDILNITTIHNSSNDKELYKSKFIKLEQKQKNQVFSFVDQLQQLEYHNSFPWKENQKQKGNIVRIEFIDNKNIDYIKKAYYPKSIKVPVTYFYYTQHSDSPQLFADIRKFYSKF